MNEEYKILESKLKDKTLTINDIGGIVFEGSINNRYYDEDIEDKIFELYEDNLTIENLKKELEKNFTSLFEPRYDNYDSVYFRFYTKSISRGIGYGTPGLNVNIIFDIIKDKQFERFLRHRFDFFNYEYEYKLEHSEKIKNVYEELYKKTWHPDRVIKWCMSIDELKDINVN